MKFERTVIISGALALIVGFGIGQYTAGTAKASVQRGSFAVGIGRGSFSRSGASGGILSGTIAKIDSASIALNTRDGSSHVVLLTPSTSVSKSVTGSTNDLSTGATVIVSGTAASDGSITAELIQLRPAGSAPPAPGTNALMIPAPQVQ